MKTTYIGQTSHARATDVVCRWAVTSVLVRKARHPVS